MFADIIEELKSFSPESFIFFVVRILHKMLFDKTPETLNQVQIRGIWWQKFYLKGRFIFKPLGYYFGLKITCII